MKRLFLLTLFLTTILSNCLAQLVNEDFESYSTGTVITTTPSTLNNYQIDQSIGCSSDETWIVKDINTSWLSVVDCNNCNDNAATIYYGFCDQNATLVTNSFQSSVGSVNISFNYGFQYYSGGGNDFLLVEIYNESSGTSANTLLNISATDYNGQYNNTVSLNTNDTYSLRFTYVGNNDWGATIDDILVEDNCGPTATFSQDCSSGLDYDITVDVTALGGGSTISISDGSTTYYSNVSTGTYVINNIVNASTIYVTNDIFCSTSQSFDICDPCNSASAPSDEACNAPFVDLSQTFIGSTDCNYTVNGDGPDAFCGSSENDSWLQFTAADDTVILDWDVSNCSDGNGVQLAVFSGICSNEDAMVDLECESPAIGTGTFTIDNLTIGSNYFIYIDGYAGDECDYSWTPQGGVAITPPNDTIGNATLIDCGSTDTSNNILASNIDAPAICGGLTPGTGVWYKYVGDGSDVTVSTDNPGTNFDTQIFVYSGAPGSLNCIGSDNNSGTGTTSEFTFTANTGTDYYIYIDGNGSSIGQMEISITCVSCNANAGNWN